MVSMKKNNILLLRRETIFSIPQNLQELNTLNNNKINTRRDYKNYIIHIICTVTYIGSRCRSHTFLLPKNIKKIV